MCIVRVSSCHLHVEYSVCSMYAAVPRVISGVLMLITVVWLWDGKGGALSIAMKCTIGTVQCRFHQLTGLSVRHQCM